MHRHIRDVSRIHPNAPLAPIVVLSLHIREDVSEWCARMAAINRPPQPMSFERHREAIRARLLRSDHERAGPGSITWKVNREVVVAAGWGRAILLQLAHPAVAAGVHDHSAFRGSLRASLLRLRSTVRAMQAITFGDTEQMIAAAAGINTIHDRVQGRIPTSVERAGLQARGHGIETQAGRRDAYSAHDPALQRWVHATLLESMLLNYERLVGPLTVRERDQYCQEAAIMEPLLGMPSGWLPRDSAQLDAYLRDMLSTGTFVVTETSRALARSLLYPPRWQVAWPAFRALQLITIGSLPPSIRDAYGFQWRSRDERALARWTQVIRGSVRRLPRIAREWPLARQGRQQTFIKSSTREAQ
jgi:uncharacterized protein (DUF2236 family)